MKTFFVIQGHTKYCDNILRRYKDTPNVIWRTDRDSKKEDLQKISKSNIQLVLIQPIPHDWGRITIHMKSSARGVKKARQNGAQYVIKIRSDMVISNTHKFLQNISYDDKIYATMYVKHNDKVIPCQQQYDGSIKWLKQRFGDKLKNLSNINYVTDWLHVGSAQNLLMLYDGCDLSYPWDPMVCQVRIQSSYLNNRGCDIDLSQSGLKKCFGVLMGKMNEVGIDIYSLKYQSNYSKLHLPGHKGRIPGVYQPYL